ncbi:TPA: hypothetical protein ENS27_18030, partial [bacterium]|nr:hypothetical protein [bacterium]
MILITKLGNWLNNINEYINSHSHFAKIFISCAIFLFVIVFFIFVSQIFVSRYSTNDDLAILSDIKAGTPTHFMSSILGNFLSLLYKKVSFSIPWYGIFVGISLVLSLFVLLRTLLVANGKKLIVSIILSSLSVIIFIHF